LVVKKTLKFNSLRVFLRANILALLYMYMKKTLYLNMNPPSTVVKIFIFKYEIILCLTYSSTNGILVSTVTTTD